MITWGGHIVGVGVWEVRERARERGGVKESGWNHTFSKLYCYYSLCLPALLI